MARTDISKLQADQAERAKSLSKQLGAPEGKKITIDPKTGEFTGPGGMTFGDELRVVVVDFCTHKTYYDRPYDPQNSSPPACMAIGEVIAEMVPEEGVPAPQSDLCKNCWANEWESDDRGKGKRCKETRELAVALVDDLETIENADDVPLYQISVSPKALKAFDAAANRAYQLFGGMPIEATMLLKVKTEENYFLLQFADIDANPHKDACFALLAQTEAMLGAMPDFSNYEAPKKLPADDVRARR